MYVWLYTMLWSSPILVIRPTHSTTIYSTTHECIYSPKWSKLPQNCFGPLVSHDIRSEVANGSHHQNIPATGGTAETFLALGVFHLDDLAAKVALVPFTSSCTHGRNTMNSMPSSQLDPHVGVSENKVYHGIAIIYGRWKLGKWWFT
jgi:hypothetical protein